MKVAPRDVYSPESALNRGSPIWKADKAVSPERCGLRFACHSIDKLDDEKLI